MADDEDGMETFEINDTDLEYAMNPGRRMYQTRDQATYGVWADRDKYDSDEDDPDARPSFGRKRQKNYAAPVNFVSGGIKVGNKMEGEADAPSSSKAGDEPIEINFSKMSKAKSKSGSSGLGKKGKQAGADVFAGLRASAVKSTIDPNVFGDWAKHGKSNVLLNMMKKMGYTEGEGLGKDGQGIVEPIQTALRKGRGAVGAYGKEATGPKFGETAADAQRRSTADGEPEVSSKGRTAMAQLPKGTWKKTAKVKTVYRTVEEVIREGGAPLRAVKGGGGVKVVDMTGPEQRVYSGYDAFSMKTRAAETEDEERETFDVPELVHNVNLLLDLTEENIRRNDHQLGALKNQTVALEYDAKRAREEMKIAEKERDRIKGVYDVLDEFRSNKNPSMNDCQRLFQRLKKNYPHEYFLYHLESVAIPLVLPLIKQLFSKWRPLEPDDIIFGVDLMKEWREILVEEKDTNMFPQSAIVFDKLCAFDRLLWDGWMPTIRSAALKWEPRDQPEEMIRVIETWLPVLPDWMKENLLDQIIVPRIFQRVEDWDPLSDTVPIHSWLLPWLHTLGDRLLPVWAPIRQKLAKALRLWNPLDKSALAMLRPWVKVWTPASMSSFLAHNIVPKLEQCMQQMTLDPTMNSRYPEFQAVLDWLELISADSIVNVLTKSFFPRWQDTLCLWLDSANGTATAVYQEVKGWYMEWQARFPPELHEFPAVRESLRRALVAIGQAMQGVRVSSMAPPPPIQLQAPPPPPPPSMAPPPLSVPTTQLSLKDVIELTAAKHGITYVPQAGRLRDGKQVFWFGSLSIYMDRGVVYAMDVDNFEWFPITVERLLLKNGVGV